MDTGLPKDEHVIAGTRDERLTPELLNPNKAFTGQNSRSNTRESIGFMHCMINHEGHEGHEGFLRHKAFYPMFQNVNIEIHQKAVIDLSPFHIRQPLGFMNSHARQMIKTLLHDLHGEISVCQSDKNLILTDQRKRMKIIHGY